MEHYASKETTIEFLKQLGFIQVLSASNMEKLGHVQSNDNDFFESPKNDAQFGFPVIQVMIYQCSNGYWCVDVDSGYMAPVVWNGPRASWDKSNTGDDFITWLDTNYPGWR